MSEIIRVADDYFEIFDKPFADTFRKCIKVRKKAELKEDRVDLRDVAKYKDFIILPDYLHHRQVYKGTFYNLFAPFPYKMKAGSWVNIETLLKHVFKEQYKLGLDYFWNLLIHPKQPLPILVLVSGERKTGKTTFLNLLSIMFGSNFAKIDPRALASSFNDSWARANIIAVDETVIDKQQTIETIKDISTTKEVMVNAKYTQPYAVPFYGKIIMTSNSEDRFMRIDDQEIRFWIRKLGVIDSENVDIVQDMINEIPAFAHYLVKEHKPTYDKPQTRMYFNPGDIETEQLTEVKAESKSDLAKDILYNVQDYFDNNPDATILQFSAKDIKDLWYPNNHNWSKAYIARVLKADCNKIPERGRYDYVLSGVPTSKVGTFYEFLQPATGLQQDLQQDNLPF